MIALDRTHVERFRTSVAQRFGLQYDNAKLDYLADVLRQRLEATGMNGADAYIERLTESPHGSDEMRALAEELTVPETFFFRNPDQYRALAEAVLPERIQARRQERRLRILSAGCASGEEPYSLAVLVREALPDLAAWDVKIIGLDVNPSMLAKARGARYTAWSLRATADDAKRRYFRADEKDFVLDPLIRGMVSFEERNLAHPDALFWPSLGCDVVFCRNVIMYFTPQTQREVVNRLCQALHPAGYLFLGHAETLRGLSQQFHLCHTHDTFYYQRSDTPTAKVVPVMSIRQPDPGATALVTAADTSTSWADAIQLASARIAALADGRRRTPAATTAAARRAGDLNAALEAMRHERFTDALQLLLALPMDAQHEPDALLLRAALQTNSGAIDEAERTCTRLLALDELNAGAHYVMALCRERAGDLERATTHDQTAVYLDPDFAMPHLHLGLMAKRARDMSAAQRALGHAVVLLAREDASRVLMFGGGFSRETLLQLCRSELRAAGGHG